LERPLNSRLASKLAFCICFVFVQVILRISAFEMHANGMGIGTQIYERQAGTSTQSQYA
jgi:hypothetical protein